MFVHTQKPSNKKTKGILSVHKSVYNAISFWELSGRVLGSRPRGQEYEPHQRHCVVVLEPGDLGVRSKGRISLNFNYKIKFKNLCTKLYDCILTNTL